MPQMVITRLQSWRKGAPGALAGTFPRPTGTEEAMTVADLAKWPWTYLERDGRLLESREKGPGRGGMIKKISPSGIPLLGLGRATEE